MPAAVKRQRPAAKSKTAPPKQPPTPTISTFTRVSKSVTGSDVKKDVDSTTTSTPRKSTRAAAAATPASRKRKAVTTIEDSDSSADEADVSSPSLPSLSTPRELLTPKRGRGRPPKKTRPTPASVKRARSPSLSDSDQSAHLTDKLFKRLRLESSPSRASSPLTTDTSLSDVELSPAPSLPAEVLRVLDLHASFLKTLTLHYAHNGSHVPADLSVLRPNVARAWGKRAVTEQDIRVCLGVLDSDVNKSAEKSQLSLVDYGRGKICIELDQAQTSGPLNEKRLNETFRSNIETLWAQRGTLSDAAVFVRGLPKASITVCESVAKAAPVLAKGRTRLAEIKQGIAAKKLEKEAKKTTTTTTTTTTTSTTSPSPATKAPLTNPDGSKMSLLDRIRHKQLQKAAMPAGLTPAEQERRAALQRVDEVAALVGMLSRASALGGGRVSFPMTLMLQKLKDSFRMGISRDEGATCVRLLAREVAPEWVMVVTLAGRENVVVETDRQLSKAEVSRRVQAIVARF